MVDDQGNPVENASDKPCGDDNPCEDGDDPCGGLDIRSKEDVEVVVMESKRVAIDVVSMDTVYGDAHRGCRAKYAYQPRQLIQVFPSACLFVWRKI